MILKHIFRFVCALLPAALLTVACQQDDFPGISRSHAEGEGLTLTFSSDPMQQYKVTTRSSDAKEDEEKEIKTLHVFFFDADGNWLTGSYLTGYTGTTGAIEQGGYIAPSQGTTLLKIDREGFDNKSAAKTATVYAVANVETSLFQDLDDNGRPKVLNQSDKTPLQALQEINYRPSTFFVTTLPDTGMPMVGSKTVDLTKEEVTSDNERIIELQALMARIDVNLQIDSETSEGNLPSMLLTSWTAKNLPVQGSFTATSTGGSTVLTDDTKRDYTDDRGVQIIYNRQGSIELSFYMFENMQQPQGSISYPTDIKEYQKQRYKPNWANENATAIEFNTQYTTYNNATYTVRYTLYLGKNHTNNYEVQRNHQYKNNITIKGLTSQASEGGEYTYDARVNIEETGNKYYISILRERNHDAHFCVTPMDVYLFADASAKPSMKVEFVDNSDLDAAHNNQPWIRMEKIPAANMQEGTLPQGMTTDDHLKAGNNFTAGHGKRRYFTTDLVTNTLAEIGKEITIDNTRDRIYFYIDENLSDSQDRTAVVKLTYYEDGAYVSERTLDITQTHFLKVQVYDRSGNRPNYNRPYADNNTFGPTAMIGAGSSIPEDGVIYMEQYEEYLDHYDPLDKYATDQIYTGLQWGCNGERVSDEQNYLNGLYYTREIVTKAGQAVMDLNDVPRSAAEYCYNRNKREPNGEVYHNWGNRSWDPHETNCKYFLPGIRQMEDALTQYYTTFPEFQGNYYWSSAAGEDTSLFDDGTDEYRARATKVNADGSYAESGEGHKYPNNGGSALRTEVLRIRAFRSDLEPLEY